MYSWAAYKYTLNILLSVYLDTDAGPGNWCHKGTTCSAEVSCNSIIIGIGQSSIEMEYLVNTQ